MGIEIDLGRQAITDDPLLARHAQAQGAGIVRRSVGIGLVCFPGQPPKRAKQPSHADD